MTGGELLLGFVVVAVAVGVVINRSSGDALHEDIGLGFLITGALFIWGFISAAMFEWLVG